MQCLPCMWTQRWKQTRRTRETYERMGKKRESDERQRRGSVKQGGKTPRSQATTFIFFIPCFHPPVYSLLSFVFPLHLFHLFPLLQLPSASFFAVCKAVCILPTFIEVAHKWPEARGSFEAGTSSRRWSWAGIWTSLTDATRIGIIQRLQSRLVESEANVEAIKSCILWNEHQRATPLVHLFLNLTNLHCNSVTL